MLLDRIMVLIDLFDDIEAFRAGYVQSMMQWVKSQVVRNIDDIERLYDRAVTRVQDEQLAGATRSDEQAPPRRIERRSRVSAWAGNMPDAR
ncbi:MULTISPECIES: hypothetical protein [Paraburkholderia]|uniref:Uncharacterized protein n=1 Tax=Paraburkholderia podalyriae TaxID=1938811 RepID=A0ABR7Q3H4_9BURK|nr:hypothetical protein [Paraburkholderia podalyriae]MBC8752899.1 hypothetical protein [Paraburkholderia podalyriae]